jgi:hypothetical protein
MKKIRILVISFLLISALSVSAQKETMTYSFINEYGFFFGGSSIASTAGLSGVFINGVSINDQNFIGIGLGYETDDLSYQSIPIFLNFRHVFPSAKILKPLVNFAFGTRFSYWSESPIIGYDPIYYNPIYGDEVQKHAFGIYSTVAAGFNVNAFSFTSGLFFRTVGKNYFSGIEVKCGFKM